MLSQFWSNPTILLYIFISVLIVDNLWSEYLLFREIQVYRTATVPEVLKPYLSTQTFDNMRSYRLHKAWVAFINTFIFTLIFGCLELYFGLFPYVWSIAEKACNEIELEHEIFISIIFTTVLFVYFILKSLPAVLYERYCINHPGMPTNTSFVTRCTRWMLNLLLSLVLLLSMTAILVALVQHVGEHFYLALFVSSLIFTGLFLVFLPLIIQPMFGHAHPIEDGPLKSEIKLLTDYLGFPISKVLILNVYDKNTPGNAFYYGSCCLKRVIIFDTLLLNRGLDKRDLKPHEIGRGLSDRQIVAVVAHELGHWINGHFYKAIILIKMHLLLTLILFGLCFQHGPIYEAVGFEPDVQPIIAGFIIVFGYVLTPYLVLGNFCLLNITRKFEYEADEFAYEMGYSANLQLALLKLYADNLSFPASDECYAAWHHTHPTMLQRLRRLKQYEEEEY